MTTLDPASFTLEMSIRLRIATKDDIPRLEWFGQYAHYRNVFRRTFREQIDGRRLILIADCNDFPVGHIFIQLKSGNRYIADGMSRAYFSSFRVMEMFRGQGLGTRILKEAELIITERGFRWATIAAGKDNPRALNLYERLGYQRFGEDPGRWSYVDHHGVLRQVEEPCWILEKDLSAL